MLSVLQKKSSALGYGRRLLINFSPPSMAAHKADSMSDFPHGLPHIRQEAFDDQGGAPEDGSSRDDEHPQPFPDNILYTIHMGCHGYENAFQCNICGHSCINKYDFACHFARGQHKQL
ncbi:unnamed protein product [Arctogadus glacialis]